MPELSGKPGYRVRPVRRSLRIITGTGFSCRSLPIIQRAIRRTAYVRSSSHELFAADECLLFCRFMDFNVISDSLAVVTWFQVTLLPPGNRTNERAIFLSGRME